MNFSKEGQNVIFLFFVGCQSSRAPEWWNIFDFENVLRTRKTKGGNKKNKQRLGGKAQACKKTCEEDFPSRFTSWEI